MGNALAAVELADFFKNGRAGLPVDDVAAMHLLKKAAATGLAIAQMRLGYYHCYGRGGLAVDEREAVRLIGLRPIRVLRRRKTISASCTKKGAADFPGRHAGCPLLPAGCQSGQWSRPK